MNMTKEQVNDYEEYDDEDEYEEPETKTNAELLKYISEIKTKIKKGLLSLYKEIKPKENKYHGADYDYDWISEDILKIVQDLDNDRLKDAYKKYKKWESEAELISDEEEGNEEYANVVLMIPFEIQHLLRDLRAWTDAYYKVRKIDQEQKNFALAKKKLTAFVKSGTLTLEEKNCIALIFNQDVKNYAFMKDHIVNVLCKLVLENIDKDIKRYLIWAVQYIKGL